MIARERRLVGCSRYVTDCRPTRFGVSGEFSKWLSSTVSDDSGGDGKERTMTLTTRAMSTRMTMRYELTILAQQSTKKVGQ